MAAAFLLLGNKRSSLTRSTSHLTFETDDPTLHVRAARMQANHKQKHIDEIGSRLLNLDHAR